MSINILLSIFNFICIYKLFIVSLRTFYTHSNKYLKLIIMGSTGSGHLSDYSDYVGAIKGVTGGDDLVNVCDKAVTTSLEDVATSEFYKKYNTIPSLNTRVSIILDVRLVAKNSEGVTIGNLPTNLNYLLGCIEEGYQYEGVVVRAYEKPLPAVVIALAHNKKP